jgi:DNA-binding NtrC family response regulator
MSDRAILIVDDEEGIRTGLGKFFRREGYEASLAATPEEALALAEKSYFAAAILDVRLGGRERGNELLSELRSRDPDLSVVMVTGYGSVESAVRAMKDGASDYILKPIDNARLLETVRRSMELARLRRDNAYLRRELIVNVYSHDIITRDARYISLMELADRVKDSEATVLLTGESGTGKEVMARYIHFTGCRHDKPFVGINCAALSETLLLSELFGHEKGSFTGATEKKVGKFEAAHRGTIFLDEIGEMAVGAQAKLLRVLEGHTFERVGGGAPVKVDVRVVAATNQPLEQAMRDGRFRRDLFFRLQVVEIRVPPLRERKSDIPILAEHFLRRFVRETGRRIRGFTPAALAKMEEYQWPGNVRELRNVVERAVALGLGPVLDVGDVWLSSLETGAAAPSGGPAPYQPLPLEEVEKQHILRTLAHTDWNKCQAAAILNIERSTLDRKIKAYELKR